MVNKTVENKLRNELITRRYLLSDESSAEIARDYDLSRTRIFQIVQDYVKKYGQPKEDNV
jgi:predicted DNA-binding protein YlxM (UPF0122 family)